MFRTMIILSLLLTLFTSCENTTNPIKESTNPLPPNFIGIPELESTENTMAAPPIAKMFINEVIEEYHKNMRKDGYSSFLNNITTLYFIEIQKVAPPPKVVGENYQKWIRIKPGKPKIGKYPTPIVKIYFDEYKDFEKFKIKSTPAVHILVPVKIMQHHSNTKKGHWTFKLKYITSNQLPSKESSKQKDSNLPPNPKLIEGITVRPSQ